MFYLFLRESERDRVQVEEGQREREAQNLKQAACSELSAQGPTRRSNPGTARSWPDLKSDTWPTEPPRCRKPPTHGFSSGHDLMVDEFEPCMGLHADSVLTVWSLFAIVSLPLSLPLPCLPSFSLSLSKINKYTNKLNKKIFFKKTKTQTL